MQMMTRDPSDASVTTSLAELQRLEEQRQRDVEQQRARARQEQARERREAEEARRRAEEARVSAEIEATRQRGRQEAEARLLAGERARAAAEVARIEAEAKVQQQAANARRAHELEILRVRTQNGHRRMLVGLASALALVLALGALVAYGMARKNTRLEQDLASVIQEKERALKHGNESRSSFINALDRRLEELRAKPFARELSAAVDEAKRARGAVEDKPPIAQETGWATLVDSAKISAFARVLDRLERQLDAIERRAALDQRYADLAALSTRHRRGAGAAARVEARRQQALRTSSRRDLDAYERALDRLRDGLGAGGAAVRGPSTGSGASRNAPAGSGGGQCTEGDPVCGMDGQAL